MKAGDLVFVKPFTFIGHSITTISGEDYSHIGIAVSPTRIYEAQYRRYTRVTDIYFPEYDVIDMGLTEEQQTLLLDYIYNGGVLGIKYDLKEVIGWAFQFLLFRICKKINIDVVKYFDNPRKFICLEAVVQCYREALNIDLTTKPDHLVMFSDILNGKYITDRTPGGVGYELGLN